MKRLLVACVPLLFTLGCVTSAKTTEIMNSWKGHHYTDLIASWGPPDKIYDDGRGGRVLFYDRSTSYTHTRPGVTYTQTDIELRAAGNQIFGTATTYPVYTRPPKTTTTTFTRYRMFWVNKSGRIYSWKWQGL